MAISRYKNGNEHKSSFCSIVPMTVQSKQSKPRPTPRDEQSTQDWMEAQEKLRMLKDRHSFLPNPRFLPLNTPHGATSLVKPRNKAASVTNERCSESPPWEAPFVVRILNFINFLPSQSYSEAPVPVFLAEPATLLFTDYTVGRVYEVGLSFFREVQSFTKNF